MVGGVNNFSQSVQELEKWYEHYNHFHELIRFELGLHAEYTASEQLMKELAQLAETYHAPVYTHMSETEEETKGCMERHGKTPTAYLDSLGMFNYGGGGYHCVWVNEEDLKIFRERGMSVVTNPGSNTKLASGIAPFRQMMEMGINIGIGTDGPASNNCLDMFREMFLTDRTCKTERKRCLLRRCKSSSVYGDNRKCESDAAV